MHNHIENICNFIHEAQKERGSVALFLRSNGKEFSDELETQFHIVDKSIKLLASLPKKQSTKIEPFLTSAEYLAGKRKYVIAKMIEPTEAFSYYTRELIAPAIDIVQELSVFDPANNPAKVSAFINFIHWKERVGIERALGTQLIEMDWSDTTSLKDRLEYIISEQQAYERMFLSLADERVRDSIKNLQENNNVFRKIEQINKSMLKSKIPNDVKSISAKEWFNLFTAKMDLLYEVERNIQANLSSSEASKPERKSNSKQEQVSLEGMVRAYMDKIKLIPLFKGLDETNLQDILKYARVAEHNKGAMIFMQGEQASRFYIVLEGWVKLFKGNADGEESILQVMTVGESLLETVIFNNAPFTANAQAVDNVKLLSIPAAIIREKLQNNKELAINMLSTVANRSQNLISQFEQLTLKNTTQRVGWFLLKLFLEKGGGNTQLKLPYDKALIAGYLGMQPETFSRTLQALKEEGIDIDRNLISLPDIYSLCGYCDSELAARCGRAGTEDCANPDCMEVAC
jgi:CRP-like cAMP-binding protein